MRRPARVLTFCLGACAAVLAQAPAEAPSTRHVYFDGALLLGVSTGTLASDIPNNVAWGFRLGMQIPASPRISFRISLEDLFFQVHDLDYKQGSTWWNQDASFDSLRAGVDVLFEPRGLKGGGPYFLVGAGSQYSALTTTLYRYNTTYPYGKEEMGDNTRSDRTSAYVTLGAGWRWQRTYLELRAFNVNYDASAGQAPGAMPQTYRGSVVIELAWGCRL